MQLPEVLCIHLKRFRHELMFSTKISSFVSFPLRGLDVHPYLHTDCVSNVATYELFSVICHQGTAGGGHYTCYSLNGNQWYEFDDQYVTKVSAETVQACEAYVLFYRKSTLGAQTIKTKVCELAESCNNSEVVYISKQWFSRFKTCAEPGPIDNSDYVCHHGFVNPERSEVLQQLAFALPRPVYDYLHKKFGGCAPLTDIHICSVCDALHKRIAGEFEMFLKLNRDFLNGRLVSTHLLSTSWFSQWQSFVQKHTFEPPGPIDNTRKLLNVANEYIEINKEIWLFFFNIYGGGPEMLINQIKASHQSDGDGHLFNNNSNNGPSSTVNDGEGASSNKKQVNRNSRNKQGCHSPKIKDVEADDAVECNNVEEHVLSNGVSNDRHSPNISSTSNTSVTDDETGQGDLNGLDFNNRTSTKPSKDKLHYKTKRRRFRCKIGYKNKYTGNSIKNSKHRDYC